MSFDNFDRQIFIAFCFGVICSKGGYKMSNQSISSEIDKRLVDIGQKVMTEEETENILEQIDNMMYLFRLKTANRKQFRSVF